MAGKASAFVVDKQAYELRELERQLVRRRRICRAAQRAADRSRAEGGRR